MTTALSSSRRAAHATLTLTTCRPVHKQSPLSRRHNSPYNHILISTHFYATNNSHKSSDNNKNLKLNPEEDRKPNPYFSPTDYGDGINAPRSTLPAPLNRPSRDPDTSTPVYYFRLGRAFGKFYWAGVKATWANHKLARSLRSQIRRANGSATQPRLLGLRPPPLLVEIEVFLQRGGKLDRSAFVLLTREAHDFGKLPLFALLVAVFGEWLPLIVPFIPGTVPLTCRIPSQVEGMRKAGEERRGLSFRAGVVGPREEELVAMKERIGKAREIARQGEQEARKLKEEYEEVVLDLPEQEGRDVMDVRTTPQIMLANRMTEVLGRDQMVHVSTTLNLHGKIWDRVGLTPYLTSFLAGKISKRLQYLNLDDTLLLADRTKGHRQLSFPELELACEDRGIDVTGRKEDELRKDLSKWFDGRQKDQGYGEQVFNMLFKR